MTENRVNVPAKRLNLRRASTPPTSGEIKSEKSQTLEGHVRLGFLNCQVTIAREEMGCGGIEALLGLLLVMSANSWILGSSLLPARRTHTAGRLDSVCQAGRSDEQQDSRQIPQQPNRRDFLRRSGALGVGLSTGLLLPDASIGATQASPPAAAPVLTKAQEAISGLFSGSVVSITKVLVKHPLDTVSVRMQVAEQGMQLSRAELWQGAWRGVLPPLAIAAPGGAIFFGVKDFIKAVCRDGSLGVVLSREEATILGVLLAQFPYWALRNPTEVVKARAQASVADSDLWDVTKETVDAEGLSSLWLGYKENILYAFPADALKFGIYEVFSGGRPKKSLSPLEGAIIGAAATGLAQALTTPFDVVRNRVMVQGQASTSASAEDIGYVDTLRTIAKEEGIPALFIGTAPRVGKAILSGFVQFGSYEFTKGRLAKYFARSG